MYDRLLLPPKGSFFLFGPRGTGKTTWLRAHFDGATWVDLLDETVYQRYLVDVGPLQLELGRLAPRSWVVLDEVQRLPSLLNEAHRQIEARKLRFALTGSSARKLRRSGVNLLAGRAVWRTMFPFAPEELGSDFDLERALRWGTLPIVWGSEHPDDTLRAYVELYLKEEIKAEALVRNLPGFARFLPVAALFHGQVLNVSGLARDAGVARTTIAEYVSILEDTLVAHRLPAFEAKLRVRERRHPKLYFVDPGLVRAIKGASGKPVGEERGALLEGLVFMLLRLYRQTGKLLFDDLAYWAPGEARETEVDFVLVQGKRRIAIEVKSGARIQSRDLKGLRAIADLPGVDRRILVSTSATDGRTDDGIDVWSFATFCRELERGTIGR
jgi:predicted AAA+ superfamily ATPase